MNRKSQSPEARGHGSQWLAVLMLSLTMLAAASPAAAQYGRAYANVPLDSNVLEVPISTTRATNYANGGQRSDLQTRFNNATVIYERTFPGFTGNTAGIGFGVPYTDIKGYNTSTNETLQNEAAVGDPIILIDYNLFGAKAMPLEEFVRTPQGTYAGLHALVATPWGSYDPSKPYNIGANRWSGQFTFQFTPVWNEGDTQFDNYLSATVYGDNNQYQGDKTLSQSTQWGYQAFLTQNLTPAVYLNAGAIGTWGGATQVNGVAQAASQNHWQGVIGFGAKAWKGATILGNFTSTIFRQSNSPRIQTLMFELFQVF